MNTTEIAGLGVLVVVCLGAGFGMWGIWMWRKEKLDKEKSGDKKGGDKKTIVLVIDIQDLAQERARERESVDPHYEDLSLQDLLIKEKEYHLRSILNIIKAWNLRREISASERTHQESFGEEGTKQSTTSNS
jgi:hypothetical protein